MSINQASQTLLASVYYGSALKPLRCVQNATAVFLLLAGLVYGLMALTGGSWIDAEQLKKLTVLYRFKQMLVSVLSEFQLSVFGLLGLIIFALLVGYFIRLTWLRVALYVIVGFIACMFLERYIFGNYYPLYPPNYVAWFSLYGVLLPLLLVLLLLSSMQPTLKQNSGFASVLLGVFVLCMVVLLLQWLIMPPDNFAVINANAVLLRFALPQSTAVHLYQTGELSYLYFWLWNYCILLCGSLLPGFLIWRWVRLPSAGSVAVIAAKGPDRWCFDRVHYVLAIVWWFFGLLWFGALAVVIPMSLIVWVCGLRSQYWLCLVVVCWWLGLLGFYYQLNLEHIQKAYFLIGSAVILWLASGYLNRKTIMPAQHGN